MAATPHWDAMVNVWFGEIPPVEEEKLAMQNWPGSQSASEEQPKAQLMLTSLQQTVAPSDRFRQYRTLGHVSGQLAQAPSLQLGVSPVAHVPHSMVLPQPSAIGPH